MRLRVNSAADKDVYRDIVRIPADQRVDGRSRIVPEGKVVRLSADAWASHLVVIRGVDGIYGHSCTEPYVHMDDVTRRQLNVQFDQVCEFKLKPLRSWGELRWAWNATEIGYRISSRLAVLGFGLGLLGVILAIVPLAGCSALRQGTGMTQAELLTAKIQCAEEGRKYEKADGESWDITYSPRLNTCVVLREHFSGDGTDTLDILDILNNSRIVDTATGKRPEIYLGATYQLWKSLFNEVNLGIDFNRAGATVPALRLVPSDKPQ